MTHYVESGLALDLPDAQHFRFADIEAYRKLSGWRLKEMDFAWIDEGTLFLMEVRSYTQCAEPLIGADLLPASGKYQQMPHRFETLINKVTDSLLMMLAVWADSAYGNMIGSKLPVAARKPLPIKLIIAIDLPPQLNIHLQALRDSLNAWLRGRIALADIQSVVLLDYARLLNTPALNKFIKLQP